MMLRRWKIRLLLNAWIACDKRSKAYENTIGTLVHACVAAYIEDTGLTCAQELKDAVIAATGKTPEQLYGIDEVTR